MIIVKFVIYEPAPCDQSHLPRQDPPTLYDRYQCEVRDTGTRQLAWLQIERERLNVARAGSQVQRARLELCLSLDVIALKII